MLRSLPLDPPSPPPATPANSPSPGIFQRAFARRFAVWMRARQREKRSRFSYHLEADRRQGFLFCSSPDYWSISNLRKLAKLTWALGLFLLLMQLMQRCPPFNPPSWRLFLSISVSQVHYAARIKYGPLPSRSFLLVAADSLRSSHPLRSRCPKSQSFWNRAS